MSKKVVEPKQEIAEGFAIAVRLLTGGGIPESTLRAEMEAQALAWVMPALFQSGLVERGPWGGIVKLSARTRSAIIQLTIERERGDHDSF